MEMWIAHTGKLLKSCDPTETSVCEHPGFRSSLLSWLLIGWHMFRKKKLNVVRKVDNNDPILDLVMSPTDVS